MGPWRLATLNISIIRVFQEIKGWGARFIVPVLKAKSSITKPGTGELYLNQKITLKNFFGARLAMF